MKKVKSLLFMIVGILLLVTCSESDYFLDDTTVMPKEEQTFEKKHAHGLDQDRYVTMKNYDDLKVHYRIIGKGPIDVVFIPGWTNPLTVYTKQFDYFRDKARCIYIDLPGTGLSDAPEDIEYTMELMADAVYKVIKKEGLHRFVGVGFSMGPKVLGMFERNYPGMIYKLVVLDGGFNPWPIDPDARAARIAVREGTYLAMLGWTTAIKEAVGASLIPPELVGEDAEQLKEFGNYFLEFPSYILANTYYHSDAENVNDPVGWMYPKLCCYSKNVEDLNMDKVDLIYPNNTVYGFPGGGHVIQWIFHEEINPIIWDFIADRPGRKY